MKKLSLFAIFLLLLPTFALTRAQANPAQPDQSWNLDQSTLTYHMSHPMHEVDGTSRAARVPGTVWAERSGDSRARNSASQT